MESTTIRIAIVEDEPLWQQGIQTLLGLDKSLVVVTVCGTAHEALDKLQPDVADVVLMDYQLGGAITGIDVAKSLMERGYTAKQIILITGSPAEQLPANDYGYVCKPQIASQLISSIQAVHSP